MRVLWRMYTGSYTIERDKVLGFQLAECEELATAGRAYLISRGKKKRRRVGVGEGV